MIKINKNITLSGQSMIEDKQIVYMNANISTDGNSNASINTTIMDQNLYELNKEECRKDIAAFQEEVYRVQDSIKDTSTVI
ncbi:hypothetical protein [Clostridium botulinum]|uniref:hypothetical protein n=1 Tax=Clostridium botulinum TaxID=1491 RepID=UPI001968141C|nr:hypothetical protein [Clostridium botulinum]MBN1050315.1 hypothetical protein [Clostridium botulinum]